ncbi:Serine/threonine-protein kinase CTR1 [Leucoagaricus sp. SymC.cos]|nr:Serine/threonine-protein kinase CTR1 [Leucoagaricus sp. SymC.cos]
MIGSSDTPKSPASALDARSTDDPTDQATSALRVMSSKDILTAQPTTSPEKASIYLSKEVIHAIQDHRKDDVLIAVIGTTDLGLDEFIGSLTHSKTGEGSAASKLRTIRLRNHSKLGNRLLLLVPPCLDGTLQSEQQALAEIQKWIDNTYPSDNVKFQGICYLHSITTQSLNSSLLNPDHEQPFNDDPALKRVLVVLYGDSDVLKCLPTIGDITNAFEARGAQVQLLMKNNGPAEAWGLVNRLIEVGEEADCSALNTSLANLEQELKKTSQGIIVLDLISKSLSSLCSAENDTKTRIAQYSRVRDLMENKVLTTPMVLDVHAGEFFTSFFTRKASDVHPESDKDHDQHYAMVLEVLDDAKLLETLQKLKDSETAQSMTDFLATMFDNTSSMSLHNKKAVLQTLDILANSVNVYPKWLEINGVKKSNKRVGGGAYADVWHADYGEEKVCVKVIRHSGGSELLKAHYREMILWAHVSSPNILPFLGIYFSNEEVKQLCIVLPWMERGNLLKYLKNVRDEKRTPPRIPLLHDVVSGLQYLHSLGIVHGDIKGENILVSKTERAMLADFGSSRFETATQAMGATQSPGSLAWMAPERFLEIVQSADTQSDAWSFGCLCYEVKIYLLLIGSLILQMQVLTTGMQPFQQYNGRPSVLRKDFHEKRAKPMKPELKDNWDKEIWSLVESCCVYEPNSRPTADTLEIFIANFNCPDERLPDSEMPSTEKTRVTPNYRSIDRILRGVSAVPFFELVLTHDFPEDSWVRS